MGWNGVHAVSKRRDERVSAGHLHKQWIRCFQPAPRVLCFWGLLSLSLCSPCSLQDASSMAAQRSLQRGMDQVSSRITTACCSGQHSKLSNSHSRCRFPLRRLPPARIPPPARFPRWVRWHHAPPSKANPILRNGASPADCSTGAGRRTNRWSPFRQDRQEMQEKAGTQPWKGDQKRNGPL